MDIGIIGAGKVGVSLGKYLKDNNIQISGFYDINSDDAAFAAQFTQTDCFSDLEELVNVSDTLFVTTPDGAIGRVWDCIKNMSVKKPNGSTHISSGQADNTKLSCPNRLEAFDCKVKNKIVCHFSGALSSDVFTDSQDLGVSVCSLHPMLAFSDKLSSYKSIGNTFFVIEGNTDAVSTLKTLFENLGNTVCRIDKSKKSLYHAAASVLSNDVIALLDLGYGLLEKCGFTREEALRATKNLVLGNVQSVVENGCTNALTGPVERCDCQTVKNHLYSLEGEEKLIHILLSKRLVLLAKDKNKSRDYSELEEFLSHGLC